MNEKEIDNNSENITNETIESENNEIDYQEQFENILEKGTAFLDNVINSYEKQQKLDIRENNESNKQKSKKFLNKYEKISNNKTETTLKETIEEIPAISIDSIVKSYMDYINLVLPLANTWLSGKGIKPIEEIEITNLIKAIIEVIGKPITKNIGSIKTTFSILKSSKKWLNLIGAIYKLIITRFFEIQKAVRENVAKIKLKNLEKNNSLANDLSRIPS